MREETTKTHNVEIHMAGDINAAKFCIQQYAADVGMCVTVQPQTFIYTGGCEEGFRIGFINYARFPADVDKIDAAARALADVLLVHLGQHSYSMVTPKQTIWVSRRESAE